MPDNGDNAEYRDERDCVRQDCPIEHDMITDILFTIDTQLSIEYHHPEIA